MAVTQNGKQLLLATVFGMITIWIYAVVGYAFLSDVFVNDDGQPMCSDVIVCWVSVMSQVLTAAYWYS